MSGTEDEEVLYYPGDLIQGWEEPFAKVLADACKGKRCDNCFNEDTNLRRCSGCKRMHYCSRECQQKDWKYAHSVECKSAYFKMPGTGSSGFKRQMCRLFAILKVQEKRLYTMYDGTTRSINDLVSHQEKLETDPCYVQNIFLMANVIDEEIVGTSEGVKKIDRLQLLFRIAGIWKSNGQPLMNEEKTTLMGSAIFIQGSYFDHSCRPTATTNSKGICLEVRAIAPIKKGERPYVTYLSGHQNKQERAMVLMSRYNFECHCTLCTEEVAGDIIRYAELKALQRYVPLEITWKTILDLWEEEVKLLRKCYVEYDERITHRLFSVFQRLETLGAPKEILKKMNDEVYVHFKVHQPN